MFVYSILLVSENFGRNRFSISLWHYKITRNYFKMFRHKHRRDIYPASLFQLCWPTYCLDNVLIWYTHTLTRFLILKMREKTSNFRECRGCLFKTILSHLAINNFVLFNTDGHWYVPYEITAKIVYNIPKDCEDMEIAICSCKLY